MDKVKKYILSLFDDYGFTSYLFDYDAKVLYDAKKTAQKIAAIIRSKGYETRIDVRETEKKNLPVWRIEFDANGCTYKVYVLKESNDSTRIFATRRDPLWVYITIPFYFFAVAMLLLYLLLFMRINYMIEGLVFIAIGLLSWYIVKEVEGRFSSGVVEIFHEISDMAAKINSEANRQFSEDLEL